MSQLHHRSNSSSPFKDDSDVPCFEGIDKKFTFNSMSDLSDDVNEINNSYSKINRLNLNSTMKKKKKKKDTRKLSKLHLINENEYNTCLCCLFVAVFLSLFFV